MKQCPHCHEKAHQNKVGKTKAGSQRFQCMKCRRKYTLISKVQGYPEEMRKEAQKMYDEDFRTLREIALHLKVSPQTVANWVEPLPTDMRRFIKKIKERNK